MKYSNKFEELYEFINNRLIDKYIIEWAGIFRYLYAIKNQGFSKEEWKELCSVSIDKNIIDTLFRLLTECDLIESRKQKYLIRDELELQRVFEVLKVMSSINRDRICSYEQKLLWTKPRKLDIPFSIAKEFRYLNNYILDLICSTKTRIILCFPYYSSKGVEQLMASFKSLLKEKSNVRIDIIVDNVQTKINKNAMNTFVKNLKCTSKNNNIRIFEASSSYENSQLFFHAKILLADGERGYMGSANFSKRGFTDQLEVGLELSKQNARILEVLIDYLIRQGFFNIIKI
ncbi:phospholipase D-like domain-containing protein [Clostridium sp. WILCCON 0269]|uniref:Phospholipase D-like domain-containing protein n=1 Tax=Candidatus Clostridium eludens TaxID=3381663 RepID=A0ABW8SJN8_9CLOT